MPRDYLVELRLKHKETQQDVADAVNISRQYYAMIESGERQKRMDMLLISSLSSHFKLSMVRIELGRFAQ